MLDIFSGLRLVVKRRTISIDNAIFRCHWFFTSTLLVSFSLVITARQYVGQPIECHSVNKLPDSLLNSYCWVQSTFTVPQACNGQQGFDVPYPCIDNTRGREIKMFAYYQWVGIVLFIQGLMFHLPYYLWKVWENGLIKAITGGLRVAVLNDHERNKKKEIVVDYIHDHLGCHKRYAFKYFICEFICLINLLLQLWATNKFFDGQFLRYGMDVIHYSSTTLSNQLGLPSAIKSDHPTKSTTTANNNSLSSPYDSSSRFAPPTLASSQQQVVDPMSYIFPRITKCTYYDFGSSGDIQKHDALCLLPLNIINEKIYIALWFWFIILGLLTILVIFYRLFAIVSESVRCKGLISRCKLSSERDIRIICRHCDVGDWFLFYMVAENLDPLIMREIIATIANKIRAHFELKRELGVNMRDDSLNEEDSIYKFRDNRRQSWQFSSFDQELPQSHSISGSRRNSLAHTGLGHNNNNPPLSNQRDEEELVPLVKSVRRRLCNRGLFSESLATIFSGIIPTSLSRNSTSTQNQSNSSNQSNLTYRPALNRENSITNEHQVVSSAPPASQMLLNSANITRRSLTRSESTSSSGNSSSSSDSFILEMQTISNSRADSDKSSKQSPYNSPGVGHLHRRFSQTNQSGDSAISMGLANSTRPKLVRQYSVRSNQNREHLPSTPRVVNSQQLNNNDDNEILILDV